jgi:riboflavin synthase
MFTGIVEELAKVEAVKEEGTNRIFEISARFDEPIRVDQSIAHNGACLTVTEIFEQAVDQQVRYSVTAVEETLLKTDLGKWKPGSLVNLERCLRVGDRLDGHFVQGHVDAVGTVVSVENRDGSWNYEFSFDPQFSGLLVDKGSICVNGVSLTVVKSWEGGFTVTIIPFTYEQTTFQTLQEGDLVNLEFDILGKYLLKNHKM